MRRSVFALLICGSVVANAATVVGLVSVPKAQPISYEPPLALVAIPGVATVPMAKAATPKRAVTKAKALKRLGNHVDRVEVAAPAEAFVSPIQVAAVMDVPSQNREPFDASERRYIEQQMALIKKIDGSFPSRLP